MRNLLAALALLGTAAQAAEPNSLVERVKLRKTFALQMEAKVLATVDFKNASLSECVEWFKKQGVPMEVSAALAKEMPQTKVTLSLHNVPALTAVKYFVNLSDTKHTIAGGKVVLRPLLDWSCGEPIMEWKVPKAFFGKNGPPENVKKYFEGRGVAFPQGTFALYSSATQMVVARNSEENLDRMEDLIAEFAEQQRK